MTTTPLNSNDRLRLGIEAARVGKETEARAHLIAVLKQDPNNIPAILWLAFVLPSPQDTIRLLKRALTLDPKNERAKLGIRWARVRLGLPPDEPEPDDDKTTPPTTSLLISIEETGEESIRSILLSEEVQQQAKKGALAHRARRTINPFMGLILIIGAVGLITIGLSTLIFVPPETLAAWMPALPSKDISPLDLKQSTVYQVVEAPSKPGSKGFFFLADTIDPRSFQEATAPTPAKEQLQTTPSISDNKLAVTESSTDSVSIDPLKLIGPVGILPPKDTDSLPGQQLAHQPAYPGEKWIEVNVTTQHVTAWEGDKPVMSFAASTGLPNTPTVLGTFNIYWKLEAALMIGSTYYLPEVPYTMYFYGGYALHGTYWHNNFGQPMSHGCINLETNNAKKLFEWAGPTLPTAQTEITATADNPGTLVVIHE